MRDKNIKEWLDHIHSLHVTEMDLSLERTREVADRLGLLRPSYSVITVGGTNGKGSCVAGLEAIYKASDYRVGAFTSPVLFRHNEYARVQGIDATDADFCQAFAEVDTARKEITLTPFEFTTLATFIIFQNANLDVCLLEVGLGGRFDAVNIIDADVSIVASIGIDHAAILGNTRELIACEKAGIFRSDRPAICGDFNPPQTLIDAAREIKSFLYCQAKDFGYEEKETHWSWRSKKTKLENLPLPRLALQNMSSVLMAVELMQAKLPVERFAIDKALAEVNLTGRIQVVKGPVTHIFDVSHNPAAAEFLANYLHENKCTGKTRAVFSMLADKDIIGTLEVIKKHIDAWYISALHVKRGASMKILLDCFQKTKIKNRKENSSIAEAFKNAINESQPGDRVVVFGSFHTVANALLVQ